MTPKRLAANLALAAIAVAGGVLLVDGVAGRRENAAEDRSPPEGRFLEVDGRQVHYLQVGEGPDLVLLHGASGSMRDWTFSFLDKVRERYRVTLFDRPGLGYTEIAPRAAGPANTRSETPMDQANLLATAAERLGVTRPVVVGHSYGGAVAMAWAIAHDPAAIVVISGATQPWEGGLGWQQELSASALGGALVVPLVTAFIGRDFVSSVVSNVFAPQEPPEGYLEHFDVGLILRRKSFRENAQQVSGLKPALTTMTAQYPEIDVPVEMLHGTADGVVSAELHSEPTASAVPGANLVLLEGLGHMPHHSDPDAIVAAIDRAAERAGLR
ncbi:pimeloyl-ACP methyl ester carboxylesterase [Palleronia aestuarii]|uniref:Pimeloyl-ACP methyl ester carboxylesterase n=1 Tax=Palleronia aestuarii TaxID=568105 RepID=A0A2W7NDK1_9RHOB|nr:alpha/beta hydrolase [Palleronia aestuarii]PZX18475.1 pimeloyl-ACP methyl ester carboxylesterase [Palleronia aestuarii]